MLMFYCISSLLPSLYSLQPPGSVLSQHAQELEVHNVSPLPLTTVLLCGYPFSLISRGQALPQVVG